MSYPEPLYFADTGEKSARLRRHDAEPDLTYASGVKVDYLATGASTDGEFGLYRWTFGPEQGGPGPHFHRTISESFFVLTGTVQLFNGDEWIDATPGDWLFVPKGGIHAFRNVVGTPASMLIMFTPGAPREGYFEGLRDMAGKTLTDEERAAFYLEHDNHWI